MTLKVKFAAIYIQILLKLPASVPCTVAALFQYETWKFYALDAWFTFFIL